MSSLNLLDTFFITYREKKLVGNKSQDSNAVPGIWEIMEKMLKGGFKRLALN